MTTRAMLATALAAVLLAGCGGRPAAGPAPELTGDLAMQQAQAEGLLDRIVVPTQPKRPPRPFTTGNQLSISIGPAENVAAVKALVAGAQRTIAIEMYNFIDDSMGRPIADMLVEKAKAGVKVQVLADFAGSNTRRGYRAMTKRLRDAGVEFRTYHLGTIIKDDHMVGVNITHRKLYLADGTVGVTGGVNLRAPFDTNTQDLLTRWVGPMVPDLYDEFAKEWIAAGGVKPITGEPVAQTPGGVRAQVAVTSAAEGRFEIRDAVYKAVDNAKTLIRIEQQYLWDDRLMLRIHAAIKRGVKVRAIVPGEEDKGVFKYIHAEEMKRLMAAGGEVRMYHADNGHAHLHTKYFGIDDEWVAIGSCNGDTRGFLDNQEIDTIITDAGVASDLQKRLFEKDWAEDTVPFVYRPGSILMRPFRGLLELIDYFM